MAIACALCDVVSPFPTQHPAMPRKVYAVRRGFETGVFESSKSRDFLRTLASRASPSQVAGPSRSASATPHCSPRGACARPRPTCFAPRAAATATCWSAACSTAVGSRRSAPCPCMRAAPRRPACPPSTCTNQPRAGKLRTCAQIPERLAACVANSSVRVGLVRQPLRVGEHRTRWRDSCA